MRTFSWEINLPDILEGLKNMPPGPLDRRDIELLFGVKSRRALQLLHIFGATGGLLLTIDRDRLEERITEMARTGELELSGERRAAIESKLGELGEFRRAPFADVRIPLGRAAYGCRLDSLPAAVRFEPGQLVIEHDGAEDLAQKLFLVAQAFLNDLPAVADRVEGARRQGVMAAGG